MKSDIMTLFPDLITGVMQQSIIGRAQAKGLIEITATNIRDYATINTTRQMMLPTVADAAWSCFPNRFTCAMRH